VFHAYRAGFGSIPDLTKFAETDEGVLALNDFFICAKEQNIKDKKDHAKQSHTK